MVFINAIIPDKDFNLKKQNIEIVDGIIKDVAVDMQYDKGDMIVDCEGFYIIPGFIDIHTHGCVMRDCSDGEVDAVEEISKFLLSQGVTSFCPTLMAMQENDTINAINSINKADIRDGSNIIGINLEGPFLSSDKKGAQAENAMMKPNVKLIKKYVEISKYDIKLITIAPELENAQETIKDLSRNHTVSLGHTNANYETVIKAFENGASHITHLFNAMPPLHHREPSLIGSFLESEKIYAEIICDGKHIHKSLVKSMFQLKSEQLITISDSMRLCGEKDGATGELAGQKVILENVTPRLEDGTIAGSGTTCYQAFLNLIDWGVPIDIALKSLTINPAKALNLDQKIGSLEKGKKADFIIMDSEFNIVAVYH